MALDSCYDCCVLPTMGSWDWEPRTLAAGDAADEGIHDDEDDFLAMCLESPASSGASSGGCYLEDAVAHWSDRCKRQKMAPPPPPLPPRPDTVKEDMQCLLESFWDSGSREGDLLDDSEMTIRETSSFISDEDDGASGREQEQEEGPSTAGGQGSAAQRGGEEAAPAPEAEAEAGPPPPRPLLSATGQLQAAAPRPLQLQKATTGGPARRGSSHSCNELPFSLSYTSLAGKEKAGKGVLYPFAFVKPLGLEGGGTAALKDVNRRILKRPARPVRHPVGPFACSSGVSADGPGLSGKAVVSLTKIRTVGKGTITIIRTRG